jgi:ATP-dependent protease ClpP protease subunit
MFKPGHALAMGLFMRSVFGSALALVAYFVSLPLLAAPATSATEVMYGGQLTIEKVDRFIKENDNKPVSLLTIQSGGGMVVAGIKLGRWVRQKNADVKVIMFCASACANYVFPAGRHKIIAPGSLVLWHGTLKQKDVLDMQAQYRELMAKAAAPEPDPGVIKALAEGKVRYEKIEMQRAMEEDFYREFGIDAALFMLGYEPIKYDTEWWTATADVMDKFGIHAVSAPAGYGTADYVNKSAFRKMYFKDVQLTFELSPEGRVVAVPLERTESGNFPWIGGRR